MKHLGAIAALKDLVAFNTEVADELRAVFDDFRATAYGQAFEVEPVENFQTDAHGQSTFALYNKPGEPDYALQVEIQPSGTVDVAFGGQGSSDVRRDIQVPLQIGSGSSSDLAAAQVVGAILSLDQSSTFSKNFRRYISDRLEGREPQPSPVTDQFNYEP